MSQQGTAEPAMAGRVPLAPVLLVNFIGTLGFSIVLPFLVFLVFRLGGNALIYGLVGATYPLFQFFGAPVLGRWSDRVGRKRVLLLSQAGTFVSWLIFCGALLLPMTELVAVRSVWLGEFTLTLPLLVLFAGRALDGLTGGNISVANAYVADISPDEERSRNFGRMGVASNLGLIAGPALAAALGTTALDEVLPVLAATAISGVAVVLIAVYLPDSDPRGERAPTHREHAGGTFGQEPLDCLVAADTSRRGTRGALARPGVLFLLGLNFVILLSFNLFYTAFPAHAAGNLGWSVVETSLFYGSLSLLLVLVEGPLLSRLSRAVPAPWLVMAGCAVLGAGYLLLRSSDTTVIFLAAALFALGNGIMWPSLVTIVAETAGEELQGAVQGLAGAVGSLAAIMGLVAGGLAFDLVGAGTLVGAAVLAFVSAALGFRLLRLPGATAARA